MERAGRIPEAGDAFEIGRVELRVLEAEPNRVVTLEARILPPAEGDAGEERP